MTTFDGGAAVLDRPGEQPPQEPPRSTRRRKLVLLALLLVVLGLLGAVFGWYLHTRKPLSALPGLAGSKLPHYELSMYGVTQPLGVAVTPSGDRVYVTQSDGPRNVAVFDRTGKRIGTLAPPTSTGPDHVPVYVAVDPVDADVYVSDRATAAVYVYSAKGAYLRAFTPKGLEKKGWAPLGLAFAQDGTLYVTDVGLPVHRVLVIGRNGVVVRTMGAEQHLSFPNGVVVDKRGDVMVSDSNNGRLLVFSRDGQVLAVLGRGVGQGALGLPRGLALDDSGRLFVVDATDHMVRGYRLGSRPGNPTYLGSFGDEGQLDGTFRFPNGGAADERGRLYVTDRDNNRVQVWTY